MTSISSSQLFTAPGSTDNGLLDGIRRQDQDAWRRFVDQYSPLIYVWCRKCDLQPADSLDVAQQVFHAVSRSIETFSRRRDGEGRFRGWLFVITKNTIRNYLERTLRGPRAQGGSSIQLRLLEEPESIEEESLSAVFAAAGESASEQTPMQDILDAVRRDFDQRTWQCFWLIAIEGCSAVEVAERLGMRPAAVRQAKYRVTRRLRLELGEYL